VDGDKEVYNPSEPSTTVCPLLPGQHLNILEVPTEAPSCRNSESPGVFTRNPSDRYLTPTPPASNSSASQNRDANRNTYILPSPSPWAPKSATYPSTDRHLSPNTARHARSASGSPLLQSTPLFADFKGLKEKLASRRSRSRSRSSSNVRDLVIGAPTLVSTTVDCVDMSLLPSYRPTPACSPATSPRRFIHSQPSVPTTRTFNPLASHPTAIPNDGIPAIAELPAVVPVELPGDQPPLPVRRRSHVPPTNIDINLRNEIYRHRANSTDTRRAQYYPSFSDHRSSSSGPRQEFGHVVREATEVRYFKPAPILQRFNSSLAPPSTDERPSSRAGNRSSFRSHSPFDKALPALPQYLAPAPLFASDTHVLPAMTPVEEDFTVPEDLLVEEPLQHSKEEPLQEYFAEKSHSHFSTWSNDLAYDSYLTSDDEAATSPTFTSLTSDFSDTGSPQRRSMRYSFTGPAYSDDGNQDADEAPADAQNYCLSATPPRLESLRISAFGPDLFNVDLQHVDAKPRRQAACFGLGFQGYSLPKDETASKTTIVADSTLLPQHTVNVKRESSVSQLEKLMDDFSYLGESVV
jgi:hypothetical protein